jgi:hypothetical protein
MKREICISTGPIGTYSEGAQSLGLCELYGKVPSKGGGWRDEKGFNHASLQIDAWFQSTT